MASCSTKPPLKLSSLDTVLRSSHTAFRIFSLRASCCVTFCDAHVSRFTRSVLHEGHLGCPQLLDAVHQSDVTNSSPENLCELPQHKPGREIGVGQTHAQVHHRVPPDSLSEWPCQVLHPPGRKGSSRFRASWPWPPAYCFAIPMDREHPIVLMCIPLVIKEFGHLFRCRGAAAWFLHIWVVVVAFIFLVGFRSASSFTGLLCAFSRADPFLVLDVASAPLRSVTFASLLLALPVPTRSSGQPGCRAGSPNLVVPPHALPRPAPLHACRPRACQSVVVTRAGLLTVRAVDHFLFGSCLRA